MAAVREDVQGLLVNRSHSSGSAKRGQKIAILVAATMAAVTVAVLASSRANNRLLQAETPHAVDLSTLYHQTALGTVPHVLEVSGFACPSGYNSDLNGKWTFEGQTVDGRAYYAQGQNLLYYDLEWSRNEREGSPNSKYVWTFQQGGLEQFDPTQEEHLFDDNCHGAAYLLTDPWDFPMPGALPPADHKWRVRCGVDAGSFYTQTLRVESRVPVQGEWRFVKTAMPKEKITITHGKSTKTSKGRRWEAYGSKSISLSGQAGILVFQGKSEGGVETGERIKHLWETEVERTEEQKVEFELSEDDGNALWQWVLIARGSERAYVLSDQFALTDSGTEQDRPKCYPGGSKDKYRYQECYDGYEIPT